MRCCEDCKLLTHLEVNPLVGNSMHKKFPTLKYPKGSLSCFQLSYHYRRVNPVLTPCLFKISSSITFPSVPAGIEQLLIMLKSHNKCHHLLELRYWNFFITGLLWRRGRFVKKRSTLKLLEEMSILQVQTCS